MQAAHSLLSDQSASRQVSSSNCGVCHVNRNVCFRLFRKKIICGLTCLDSSGRCFSRRASRRQRSSGNAALAARERAA
eukprot:6178944-Pleurochrysis_carterae.AAC.1